MTPQELRDNLEQFNGTEKYYRISRDLLLTDGAKYLAENAGAFWLFDLVASHLHKMPSDESFAVVLLNVSVTGYAYVTIADDEPPNKIYAAQYIPATDFPLSEIKLYLGRHGDAWVCYLTSEH